MVFETVMLFQKEEGEDSFVWPERIGAQRRCLSWLRGKAEGFREVGGKTVRSERRPWERAAGTVLRLMRARWGGADWH